VMGTLAFCQDIADACQLQYGTDRTTGNNTGTFGCRTQEHTTCTVYTDNFMRNGTAYHGNCNQILLCVFHALPDRFRNFGCFTQAHADLAFSVADYNQCGKGEATATFNNFRNAVDEY